jgi:septal ring factor EnvC (AmiA/AmiB activator)|tara:strand:- start:622 stop:960 length:339 start_codon:yes stop_codon:yes gene_type:complete
MAFKGVLPSDLWYKYDTHDGMDRLKLDLEIAAEINSLISEAHADAKNTSTAKAGDAAGAVKRKNQRREQRKKEKVNTVHNSEEEQPLSNTDDFFSIVERAGVPVRRVSGDER